MKVRIQLGSRPAPVDHVARERLGAPFTVSMVLHGMLFGVALFGGVLVGENQAVQWGEEGPGGGHAVPVNLAPSVPLLPSPGPQNPLASPTKELYPAEVKPPSRETPPAPDPRELQIAEREAKKKLRDLERRQMERELAQLRPRDLPPGAIPGTTSSGRASSGMFGMSSGQGAGGIGVSGEFGTMYGWYVRKIRNCIAGQWDRNRVEAAIRVAPKVYVEFDIMRDGIIRNERVAQSSNIPTVDREALRAVQACSGRREVGANVKLDPLPQDYPGSSVHVEVWFEFKK